GWNGPDDRGQNSTRARKLLLGALRLQHLGEGFVLCAVLYGSPGGHLSIQRLSFGLRTGGREWRESVFHDGGAAYFLSNVDQHCARLFLANQRQLRGADYSSGAGDVPRIEP